MDLCKSLKMFPKNKKGGVVTSTIMGVGGLVIATIVILVVVQTLNNANIIPDTVSTSTVVNESMAFGLGNPTSIDTISVTDPFFTSWNATLVLNTTIGTALGSTNNTLVEGVDYSINTANRSLINLTATWNSSDVTYDWVRTFSASNDAVNNLTTNFTAGIDEIALQIPTILLIVAVVFLFGALVLLIKSANMMGKDTQAGGSGSL